MRSTTRALLILYGFILLTIKIHAQDTRQTGYTPDLIPLQPLLKNDSPWVDSVFNTLSDKEKIGQLFMVPAYSNRDAKFYRELGELIKKHQVGGIIFFQGGPLRQSALLNRYQSLLKVPALVAMDAEWGVGMRLDSVVSYPYQMTLGAIQNDQLIYDMGVQIARDFKRLGMHINFAPVVDVNNNINNPVINFRSFGEDIHRVADKGFAYMKGLQDERILATAKHFPGHGDTDVDSHHALPRLPFSRKRLDSLELHPFSYLSNRNLGAVMIAHMSIPSLDPTPNLPSTLSRPIITGLLKEKMGFEGLIFTDAMRMKGVTRYFPAGEAEVRAFKAGNDMIEMSADLNKAIAGITAAVKKGEITWEEIDQRVKRILAAKEWAGLNRYRPVELEHLYRDLNRKESRELNQELAGKAVTLLRHQPSGAFPLPEAVRSTAVISIGSRLETEFQRSIRAERRVTRFNLPAEASREQITQLRQLIQGFHRIIIGIHDTGSRPRSTLSYSRHVLDFITETAGNPAASFAVMANAYTLHQLKGIEKARVLILTYENSRYTQRAAAKFFTGELKPGGKLPVTVNGHFKAGDGLKLY